MREKIKSLKNNFDKKSKNVDKYFSEEDEDEHDFLIKRIIIKEKDEKNNQSLKTINDKNKLFEENFDFSVNNNNINSKTDSTLTLNDILGVLDVIPQDINGKDIYFYEEIMFENNDIKNEEKALDICVNKDKLNNNEFLENSDKQPQNFSGGDKSKVSTTYSSLISNPETMSSSDYPHLSKMHSLTTNKTTSSVVLEDVRNPFNMPKTLSFLEKQEILKKEHQDYLEKRKKFMVEKLSEFRKKEKAQKLDKLENKQIDDYDGGDALDPLDDDFLQSLVNKKIMKEQDMEYLLREKSLGHIEGYSSSNYNLKKNNDEKNSLSSPSAGGIAKNLIYKTSRIIENKIEKEVIVLDDDSESDAEDVIEKKSQRKSIEFNNNNNNNNNNKEDYEKKEEDESDIDNDYDYENNKDKEYKEKNNEEINNCSNNNYIDGDESFDFNVYVDDDNEEFNSEVNKENNSEEDNVYHSSVLPSTIYRL
jgi:hypothetical protein